MRKLFSRQLVEARHEMLSIYEAVDLALHDAVKAYVADDRKLATKTKKRTRSIDARCANLEAVCYNLIATQSPVASDFRLLQTIIYVDFNLQRMTDKVRQICRAASHMVKADISLPKELVGTVEAEAEAMNKRAAAYSRYNEAAVLEMLVNVLPAVAKEVAAPMGNIDKLTVISTDGAGQLPKQVGTNVAQVVEMLKDTTGVDLSKLVARYTGETGESEAEPKRSAPAVTE